MNLLRQISIALLSLLFIGAGINHFLNPNFYVGLMPPYIPAPLAMVYISGVFEILGGIGLWISRVKPLASWGLIALLIAVSPVHIHMLVHAEQYDIFPYWTLVARIPIQFLLMAWVAWATSAQKVLEQTEVKL